ncbi:tetratricopeptide repeat protein [Parvibaculum sedimenti]|nr:tetratricopeptide repeat protein [Parvibaculum sedimenti]
MSRRQKFAALILSLGLTLGAAGTVHAEPTAAANAMFNAGVEAFRAGDITAAVDSWSQAAKGGHGMAGYLVARLYEQGRGVPQSDGTAFHYYLLAAQAGNAQAADKVGLVYRNGNAVVGVKRDYQKAFKMFEVGALAAWPDAQYHLADMYRRGLGVPIERSESLRWLILAAEKRHVLSLLELARIYFDGEGVQQDRITGWSFLDLANRFAEPNNAGRVNTAMTKYSGRMRDGEKEQAKTVADDWLAKHEG